MPEIPLLPPVADQAVSVVLLTRDAADRVESLVSKWIAGLDHLGRPWELIVADDASRDHTADRAEALQRVTVVRHTGEPAEGLALRAALDRCRHPLVFTARLLPWYSHLDLGKILVEKRAKRPDNGQPCAEIDLVHLATGYRIGQPVPPAWSVVGSAWRTFQRVVLSTSPTALPGWLGWRAHAAGLLWRLAFGVRNRDAFSPVRLFRRELLPLLALQSASSFVHVEFLAKATFLGKILSEDIPVGTEPKRGQVRRAADENSDSAAAIWRDFHRLYWRPVFGRPAPESA